MNIQISPDQEQSTDILLSRFEKRFLKEVGRSMTVSERESCWWEICGEVFRNGFEAGKQYVDTARISCK